MNELQSAYGAKTDELLGTIFALDAGDNEPARFWCYVITACQRFAPELRQDALKWMRKAAQPS